MDGSEPQARHLGLLAVAAENHRAALDLLFVFLVLEQGAERVLRDLRIERARPEHDERTSPIHRLGDAAA